MYLQRFIAALILGCAFATATGGVADARRGGTPVVIPPPDVTPPPVITNPPVATPPLPANPPPGFVIIAQSDWNRAAVERVLHAFAFGGRVTPQQIDAWTKMTPQRAIQEMLTVDPTNARLAAPLDKVTNNVNSIESLQRFLASNSNDNPVCPYRRGAFSEITSNNGGYIYSKYTLQRAWYAAAMLRGSNPFRHKIGLWFTNYLMPVNAGKIIILRDLYNRSIDSWSEGKPLWQILSDGAGSAAVAFQYGLQNSVFDNSKNRFTGDDNFAREYFQIFFGIHGDTEPQEYHENTTIKNMALLLTGMGIDLDNVTKPTVALFGADDNYLAPIVFTDHVDPSGRKIDNRSKHHADPLEILGEIVAGATAKEKLDALSSQAGSHPESLDTLPVRIVEFFGDNNLTPEKTALIRQAWKAQAGQPHDLINFIRYYAISQVFHESSTVKIWNAFDRNITIDNIAVADNSEFYALGPNGFADALQAENAEVFTPVHGIFGGQTGIEALNDSGIFQKAYNRAIERASERAAGKFECKNTSGNVIRVLTIDRRAAIPTMSGRYRVGDVAGWLWQRLTADGGRNLGVVERAHLAALLAKGADLATVLDPKRPTAVYTAQQLAAEPLASKIRSLENVSMALASSDQKARESANRGVGLAISFISATPYAFAMEGR